MLPPLRGEDLRDLNLRRPVEAYGPISSLNGTREVHMAHGRDPVTAPVRFRASCVACLFRPTSDLFLLVYPTVPPISAPCQLGSRPIHFP